MVKQIFLGLWIAIVILVSACQATPPSTPDSFDLSQPTPTPFQPVTWTADPGQNSATASSPLFPRTTMTTVPTPIPTEAPFSFYIDPILEPLILPVIQIPIGLPLVENPDRASLKISIGNEYPISQWVYALVAPFPTLQDGVSSHDLRAVWDGKSGDDFRGIPIWMSESTKEVLSVYWGQPADGSIHVGAPDRLLKNAWKQDFSWAIIPFEQLEPRWKVLAIDGNSPIHKDFDLGDYELVVPISMTGAAPDLPLIPPSNRDPEKMTILAMTGVTALVRATAFTMEQRGATYPAVDLSPILRAADITHISNEVPFAETCPYPNPVQEDVRFCSRTKYIELLESIDTDIVELTGDHFADWGADAMHYTLDLYNQRGWLYYGGGANFKDGRKPAVIEHNGNKFAFIGCNAKGGGFATASESTPGAVYCDWDWMQNKITDLRAEDYLPIATFQHFEYYTYSAQPNQVRDARRLIDAGAVIVSGSQAHQPQAFEFLDDGFAHHGLGNLFFDQLDVSEATRQGFIDLHVFYDGRHISTELVTIYFVDYARARLMTPQERSNMLQVVFSASGW